MTIAMSVNSPFDDPSGSGIARRGGEDDVAVREADQRKRTIRLAIIGLVAGTSLGYVAVSMHNGDLAWLKNLGSGAASVP